jgi:hypothetical protein
MYVYRYASTKAIGYTREILAVDFFGVDAVRRVAQFVASETVETGVVGVQFGAELGTIICYNLDC